MDGIARLLQDTYVAGNDGFVPFLVEEAAVGWLRPNFSLALRKFPDVFAHDGARAVRIRAALATPDARSRALAVVVRELARTGVITGWRDELYAVRHVPDPGAPALFTIERAAARAFGIMSLAVHVNGSVEVPGDPALWIARRSLSKPIDPGMLDNMIGGGLPYGLSVAETLAKEAWEEAGLAPAQVAAARAGRRVRIRRPVPEGLQSEVIFVHDLELPPEVIPQNQDGEVSAFERLPAAEVIALLGVGDRITPDASLVILDWLDRRGILPLPDTAQARAIFGGAAPAPDSP